MGQQDISGYSNYGAQNPNAASIGQTEGVQASGPSQVNNPSASSISKSELEALVMMLAAGVPILQIPNIVEANFGGVSGAQGVSGTAANSGAALQIEMLIAQKKSDIITAMWTKYNETLRELATQAREEEIKKWTENLTQTGPKSAGEYQAYLMSVSGLRKEDELGEVGTSNSLALQFNQSFSHWFVDPVQQSGGSQPVGGVSAVEKGQTASLYGNTYPDPNWITGCLTCSPDVVRDAIATVGIAAAVSLSPVTDAVYAVGPNTGLPMDSQAAAAMIAALLNGGAVSKASATTIVEAMANGQPAKGLDFAKNYAQQIMAIITHDSKSGEPLSKEQSGQNSMIKLMLATMALNMVYRAAYGGMSGEEFAALIKENNTTELPPQIADIIRDLVRGIKANLPEGAEQQSTMIASLMAYIDSKDSVDSMLQTTRTFFQTLSNPDVEQGRLLAKGG